ncbi:MAG TPA: MFS transporter [Actinomycetota bacterium]|jgi:MFS family permease|nr:MFS transporter [Actinomycetota bacterium]
MAGNDERGGLREALSLLRRNRDFRRLYIAQLVSYAGDWFATVALLGLVHDLTGSTTLTVMIIIVQLVAFAVLSPLGGYLADRFDRRRLMVGIDLTRAVLALGLLVVRDPGFVWLALVLTAATTGLGAIFEPAALAAVPNLVEEEDLAAANVLVGAAWGTMLAVGGALGGLVAATLGRDAAFVGNAISFLLSALLLMGIHRAFAEPREEGGHVGMVAAVAETFRYARRDHRVLALLAVKAGLGLGGGVIGLLALFSINVFHTGDAGTGVLFAFRGVGALVGPLLIRPFVRDNATMFRAIAVSLAVYGAFYGIFPFAGGLWTAAPFALLAHLGGGAQWTLSTYGLQRLVPDRIRGRVFSFDYGLVTLTIALSNLVAGAAAERFHPRTVMLALAAVSFAYAITWTMATAGIRRSESAQVASET